ncbi:MAG: hypothetical protein EOP00_15090 [Pedobacter sp.]|nr:MAG: hypothetical protein EOP00_15090 [Pedobacter sp.]
MDDPKFHIVFPKDGTTDFLQGIIDYLIDEADADIKVHRLETAKEHEYFLSNAEEDIPDTAIVIFMGHGMSSALSGADTPEYSYNGAFIKNEQLSIFKNKKVILLSCRSTDYLETYFTECNLKAGIGFPNLITDIQDTYYPDDPDRVKGVLAPDILLFRQLIVDILKYSLEDFIKYNLPFYQIFTRIQLRVQRALINFYKENIGVELLPLGKMIYDLNKGLSFRGN